MMKNALITIAGIALLSAALPAEAVREPGLGPLVLDNTDPTVKLEMNDRKGAGPIIWVEEGVMPEPGLPADTIPSLSSLGCDGTINNSAISSWSGLFNTNFSDPQIQNQTYFFRELGAGIGYYYSDAGPYSFSLRAQDKNGISRIKVSLIERGVVTDRWNYVTNDGPTEFYDVSQQAAVASLHPIYLSGGKFSHWEKQLNWEPNVPVRWLQSAEVHLDFSLTHFGLYGRIDVEVEDRAGNVTTSSVYLADDKACD
ncbi:MAG: hypothetical protein AAF578_09995 [Pseudomonadota bacterium]